MKVVGGRGWQKKKRRRKKKKKKQRRNKNSCSLVLYRIVLIIH
jgi:hypothetical protein